MLVRTIVRSVALSALSLALLAPTAHAEATTAKKKAETSSKVLIKLDTTAIKLQRDDVRQLYLQAKQQVRFGQIEEAVKGFRAVYRREGLADVLFDMAECEARLGHMAAALSLHRRYVRSFKTPLDRLVAAARFGAIVKRIQQERRSASAQTPAPSAGATRARNRP